MEITSSEQSRCLLWRLYLFLPCDCLKPSGILRGKNIPIKNIFRLKRISCWKKRSVTAANNLEQLFYPAGAPDGWVYHIRTVQMCQKLPKLSGIHNVVLWATKVQKHGVCIIIISLKGSCPRFYRLFYPVHYEVSWRYITYIFSSRKPLKWVIRTVVASQMFRSENLQTLHYDARSYEGLGHFFSDAPPCLKKDYHKK